MGVPAFFRWLSNKYSTIVVNCVEEKPKEDNGVKIPVDTSKPNPNNVEFDNLYLDMNGIIHPCCHPENKPAPKNEDEMMVLIFEYIDRIFSVVRPRKLLYMAIDGVAPRAKMNQQRSRRFRAAQEAQEKVADIARIKAELRSKGAIVPEPKEPAEHFDSNCITPGTPFMDRLAKCLRYYVHDRLNNDLGWKNIKVILSDANVPGEGEHKIMDYIRRQRASPDHDPNTHHCLCGADADLIMLGLATHEPNFTIIREEFKPNQPRPCDICGQLGHEMKECTGLAKEKQGEFDELEKPFAAEVEFIFLRLNILREYLERELELPGLPFTYVFERAIDDWVFMCFFVGNDFLPHLPSLEIRENAIDRLVAIYKQTVVKTGGYLTDSGVVNLSRVQMVMQELGKAEDVIFKMRQENEISFRQRMKDKKKREKLMKDAGQKPAWMTGGQYKPSPISKNPNPIDSPRQTAYEMRKQSMSTQEAAVALTSLKDAPRGQKRKHDDSDSDEEPEDNVRLWEDGWKERYYKNKFDVALDDVAFRYQVGAAYVEGLCWVLRYYYQGCASWKWFFPYHYAPFASDFVEIGNLKNDFETGTVPFNPMEQLMGVFPAASGGHVPPSWSVLMADPDSEIIDFYPETFKIDLNGKKYAWQGVALLPFVDEKRLLRALAKVYPDLTPEEKKRNTRGSDRLFVGKYNASHDFLEGLYEGVQLEKAVEIDPKLTDGMSGTVWLDEYAIMTGGTVRSPVPGLPELHSNRVMSVQFKDPQFPDNFLFKAERLPGAKEPMHVLTSQDFQKAARGGARGGFRGGARGGFRPQIGFSANRQHASLDASGHRTLSHHMNTSGNGRGNYSSSGSQSSGYGQNQGGYRGQSNQQQGLLGRYGNQQQGLMGQYQDRNKAQNIRSDSRMYNEQSYQYSNNDRNSRGGYQNRQNYDSNRYNSNQSSGRYPPPPRRNPY